MKTHFIFNQSLLSNSEIILLIRGLVKNNFPVSIISDQMRTAQLRKKNLGLKQVNFVGRDQGETLHELYLAASPQIAELRYLTVVFADTLESSRAAKKLGLYVIRLKNHNLDKALKKFKINAVHQLQYLPEINKIQNFLQNKLGYPASIMQYLHGVFTKTGVKINQQSKKLLGEPVLNLGNFNFFINNPGDPFILSDSFIGHTCVFEQEIIDILGQYYGLPAKIARGFVTTDGTEGNFSGLWWARNNLRMKFAQQLNPQTPIALYFSAASHYSLGKIAEQLDLQTHIIPTEPTEVINLEIFAREIKRHMQETPQIPLIVSANAGTTKTGAIDDILQIKRLLESVVSSQGGHFIIHLDAACIGAVLPLLRPYGDQVKNYFSDLNISSIAISGHKFFGMASICGIVLTTHDYLAQCINKNNPEISYVGHIHDITPSGSRSGNNVLQLHNILYMLDVHTDRKRLKKVLHQCQINCEYFYRKLLTLFVQEKILWLKNSFSIIFPRPSHGLIRKYSLMPIADDRVGIYGLVNLEKKLIDQFIAEYKKELVRDDDGKAK